MDSSARVISSSLFFCCSLPSKSNSLRFNVNGYSALLREPVLEILFGHDHGEMSTVRSLAA